MLKNCPLFLLFVPLLALGLLAAGLAAISPPAGAAPGAAWDDALRQAAAQAAPDTFLPAIAYLPQQQDPLTLNLPAGRTARAGALMNALQSTAAETQGDLRSALDTLARQGQVRRIRPLWIVNAIGFEGSPAALSSVSGRSDVAELRLDASFALPESDPETASGSPLTATADVAAMGAPATWYGLGITGTGVTVALMDSGVDWTHPALQENYRGRQNGVVAHPGNWYDASNPNNDVPFDPVGHGTHVAGLAVGRQGIGAAPGAHWIAVKISNDQGQIQTSVVLDAYQWLLAPNGDPALAPDVVNASWGSSNSTNPIFAAGVATLRAAGVIQVYSAGNAGSLPESLNAPASYPETIAVGALDQANRLAWYSSRGPSPLTIETKPLLAAPGTRVLSSWPGGGYARLTGTSMAAPLTAGTIALLLDAAPRLTEADVVAILSDTAGAMSGERPNNDSGWGWLDAYHAVARALFQDRSDPPGTVSIDVLDGGTGVSNVAITVTTPAGPALHFTTDGRGNLDLPLRAGTYQVSATHFGYLPAEPHPVTVTAGATGTLALSLVPLPAGTIAGQVRIASDSSPVAYAALEIDGAPREITANGQGRFQVTLPAGSYTLRTISAGTSMVTRTVTVAAGITTRANFVVAAVPSILLVDGGSFLFLETGSFFETALRDNELGYDLWPLTDPFFGHPPADVLDGYDAVIWSAPRYSPAVGNGGFAVVLFDYLDNGGQLLVSGQEVGRSVTFGISDYRWWRNQLGARYISAVEPPAQLQGAADTPFAALSLSFNGSGSANNQYRTEVVEPRPGKLTTPLFRDAEGNISALRAGKCEPFEIVYFGFGLEGVSNRDDRASLVSGALDYFTAPPPASGARVARETLQEFVLPGTLFTATLPIFNLGEVVTDTFDLTLEGAVWPSAVTTSTMTLGPCQTAPTELRVHVPADVDAFPDQQLTLNIRSRNDPGLLVTYTVDLQTPQKPVLLVDDDRFYDVEGIYQEALDEMGVDYDVWTIGWDNEVRGSPTGDFLAAYDVVLWFTGYDWFQPLSAAETETVADYVRQGGRLFFSSQDYLYYHDDAQLTGGFFSVATYTESLTTTVAYGAGPLAGVQSELTYPPYQNNSDGLYPEDPADVQLWGNRGLPVGVQQSGPEWRTVFWVVPLEKMDETERHDALGGILRQLVDLGESTWTVDPMVGPAGRRTYTLTLRNDGPVPRALTITNTIPISLNVEAASVGGAEYDPVDGTVTWSGSVPPGAAHVVTYRAEAADGAGGALDNPVIIADRDYGWQTAARVRTWIDAPDLTVSALTLSTDGLPPAVGTFTATLVLHNQGEVDAAGVTATIALPPPLTAITGTLTGSAPGVAMGRDGPEWRGAVPAGSTVTMSIGVRAEGLFDFPYLPVTAYIEVTSTAVLLRPAWIPILTHDRWLPVIDSGG